MIRIAIDMDNVMADITSHFINWYKQKTGVIIEREALLGKNEIAAFPDARLVRSFLYEPGFFKTAPVMPGSQEIIKQLHKYHEVFIVSAAMEFPQSLSEKYDWLKEHFSFIGWEQIVLCGSKRIINADYMIDDHLKNLDYFNGEKLLFTATHNVNIDGYRRVDNWKDVADIFLTPEMISQALTLKS